MARMLGRGAWYGVFCSCCNGPRSNRQEKAREKQAWRRELRPEGLLPTPLDDHTACIHDCHGECLHTVYGDLSEHGCRFWCHLDGLPSEADYWRARAEHAAAVWPGGSIERAARESHPAL